MPLQWLDGTTQMWVKGIYYHKVVCFSSEESGPWGSVCGWMIVLDVAMRNTKHNTILSISRYLRETLKKDFFNIMKQKGDLTSSPLDGRHVLYYCSMFLRWQGEVRRSTLFQSPRRVQGEARRHHISEKWKKKGKTKGKKG
jgi:hypothetical protein